MSWGKVQIPVSKTQLLGSVTLLEASCMLEWGLLQLDVNLPGPAHYFMAFGNTNCNFPS